jgi:hypothetical protein
MTGSILFRYCSTIDKSSSSDRTNGTGLRRHRSVTDDHLLNSSYGKTCSTPTVNSKGQLAPFDYDSGTEEPDQPVFAACTDHVERINNEIDSNGSLAVVDDDDDDNDEGYDAADLAAQYRCPANENPHMNDSK